MQNIDQVEENSGRSEKHFGAESDWQKSGGGFLGSEHGDLAGLPEIKMDDIKNKLNKPLIIITFIILVWLGVISNTKELFHMNSELNEAFINGGLAGIFAKGVYMLALFFGSFIGVYWIKILWNNLLPRITNWKEINYWEAMGITAFILFFTIL